MPCTQLLGLARVLVVHDGIEFDDFVLRAAQELADEFGVFDAFLVSVLIAFVGIRDRLAGSTQVGNEIL